MEETYKVEDLIIMNILDPDELFPLNLLYLLV